MSDQNIYIKGAKVNNLKNVDVEIPRNELVVITGVSGSACFRHTAESKHTQSSFDSRHIY